MKKELFICLAAAATFVCLMSCENPVMKTWWEEQGITGNGAHGSNNGKVDPVVRWPKDITAIFGQKLSDIALPCNCTAEEAHGTFTWTKPNISLSKMRKQTYNMTFTPDDTSHYNVVTKDVEITIIVVNMVPIPAGTFMMGSPASEPGRDPFEDLHQVTLSGFFMSEFTVTEELYELVMGNYPMIWPEAVDGESDTPEQLPATMINWYDTLVFCNKLSIMMGLTPAYSINGSTDPADWGRIPTNSNDPNQSLWDTVTIVTGSKGYRMPTEAQWEYACRAGTTTAYNTGDIADLNTGWYDDSSNSRIIQMHKVGLLPANAWGLYDMHGNVYEWCWDWYDVYYYFNSPANNPTGPSSGKYRTVRGGAFKTVDLGRLRSAYRAYDYKYQRWLDKGIRLVHP